MQPLNPNNQPPAPVYPTNTSPESFEPYLSPAVYPGDTQAVSQAETGMVAPAWAGTEKAEVPETPETPETQEVPKPTPDERSMPAIGAVGVGETVEGPDAPEPIQPEVGKRLRDYSRVEPYPTFRDTTTSHDAPNMSDTQRAELTAIRQISTLDPELMAAGPDTAVGRLMEAAVDSVAGVTAMYGTPDHPHWADVPGGYELKPVLMTYHNGGPDGHTSFGPDGAGVPRTSLILDARINEAVGHELRTPQDRAEGVVAAGEHDWRQLCGRTLLPEGQGEGLRGDERLSAEEATEHLLALGLDPESAARVARRIGATAFNPQIGAQNVDYSWLDAEPDNPAAVRDALGQEITGAADLGGITGGRARLGAFEYIMETLTMAMKGNIAQERLEARGVDPLTIRTPTDMMRFIARDKPLREAMITGMQGQVGFFKGFKFSDRVIKAVTRFGVDDLLPGRAENAIILAGDVNAFAAATRVEDRMAIWHGVRRRAGYR